jgi:hypothetical protein
MTSLLKNIQAGMVSLKTSKVLVILENQVSKTVSLVGQEVFVAAATAAMNAYVCGQVNKAFLFEISFFIHS